MGVRPSQKAAQSLRSLGNLMLQIIEDLDIALWQDRNFLLGPWIESIRLMAGDEHEAALYEFNLRNLLTLWGPNGEINDYGARALQGLVGDYYYRRWQLLFLSITDLAKTLHPIPRDFFY